MFITSEDRGPIRWLILNRPETRNAIPVPGWEEIENQVQLFDLSSQRVLVIAGAGGDFCSGADLGGENASSSVPELAAGMEAVGRAAIAVFRSSKPTIAAIDGVAVGAGLSLALACDVAVATDRSRFSAIFVRRGLTVDFGGSWLLPRVVGLQRAKELVMSGRILPAEEAQQLGLCLEVVPPAELITTSTKLAQSFASGSPIGQMFSKQHLNRSFELSFEEAIALENQAQIICLATEDANEGMLAFMEKREPDFQGR